MTDQPGFPDRAQQLNILRQLKDTYPTTANVQKWEHPNLTAELLYLQDHGLVKVQLSRNISLTTPRADFADLTAKGIDFLQGDGGLSAILDVVTIKLHDDTIKSLIEAKIKESDLPQPDKRRYLDALRELPAETTKHLVLKLVDMGLDHKEAAISVIGKWIGAG